LRGSSALSWLSHPRSGWPAQFGEIGIDDALVKQKFDTEEEIFEMNNGCICCTVRGDLVRILGRLIKRKAQLDGIIIVRHSSLHLLASAICALSRRAVIRRRPREWPTRHRLPRRSSWTPVSLAATSSWTQRPQLARLIAALVC